jgi:putative colanic acid biosynthesis acetyltransferase WcaF
MVYPKGLSGSYTLVKMARKLQSAPAYEGMRRLADFSNEGYSNGRRLPSMVLWFAAQNLLFDRWWFPPSLRPWLLRRFGAEVGEGCLIRHGVRIHWPWRVAIGDHCWIGEGVWLHSIDDIVVEDNVCISQRASIVTGSHDHRDPAFHTDNGPIRLRSGCWIGAEAMVARGVTVGLNSVVGARALAYKDVPDNTMLLYPEPRVRPLGAIRATPSVRSNSADGTAGGTEPTATDAADTAAAL